MKFKIPAQQIKSAMVHAAKKDVRYYLNGIHITKSNNVVTTNGHCLYLAENEAFHVFDDTEQPLNLKLNDDFPDHGIILDTSTAWPTITNKITFVGVAIDYTSQVANISYHQPITKNTDLTNQVLAFSVKLIDGRFPDYQRVMPSRNDNDALSEYVGLMPEYLASIAKTFPKKFTPIKMDLFGDYSAVKITSSAYQDQTLIIMPARV